MSMERGTFQQRKLGYQRTNLSKTTVPQGDIKLGFTNAGWVPQQAAVSGSNSSELTSMKEKFRKALSQMDKDTSNVERLMKLEITKSDQLVVLLNLIGNYNEQTLSPNFKKLHLKLFAGVAKHFRHTFVPFMPLMVQFFLKKVRQCSQPAVLQVLVETIGQVFLYAFTDKDMVNEQLENPAEVQESALKYLHFMLKQLHAIVLPQTDNLSQVTATKCMLKLLQIDLIKSQSVILNNPQSATQSASDVSLIKEQQQRLDKSCADYIKLLAKDVMPCLERQVTHASNKCKALSVDCLTECIYLVQRHQQTRYVQVAQQKSPNQSPGSNGEKNKGAINNGSPAGDDPLMEPTVSLQSSSRVMIQRLMSTTVISLLKKYQSKPKDVPQEIETKRACNQFYYVIGAAINMQLGFECLTAGGRGSALVESLISEISKHKSDKSVVVRDMSMQALSMLRGLNLYRTSPNATKGHQPISEFTTPNSAEKGMGRRPSMNKEFAYLNPPGGHDSDEDQDVGFEGEGEDADEMEGVSETDQDYMQHDEYQSLIYEDELQLPQLPSEVYDIKRGGQLSSRTAGGHSNERASRFSTNPSGIQSQSQVEHQPFAPAAEEGNPLETKSRNPVHGSFTQSAAVVAPQKPTADQMSYSARGGVQLMVGLMRGQGSGVKRKFSMSPSIKSPSIPRIQRESGIGTGVKKSHESSSALFTQQNPSLAKKTAKHTHISLQFEKQKSTMTNVVSSQNMLTSPATVSPKSAKKPSIFQREANENFFKSHIQHQDSLVQKTKKPAATEPDEDIKLLHEMLDSEQTETKLADKIQVDTMSDDFDHYQHKSITNQSGVGASLMADHKRAASSQPKHSVLLFKSQGAGAAASGHDAQDDVNPESSTIRKLLNELSNMKKQNQSLKRELKAYKEKTSEQISDLEGKLAVLETQMAQQSSRKTPTTTKPTVETGRSSMGSTRFHNTSTKVTPPVESPQIKNTWKEVLNSVHEHSYLQAYQTCLHQKSYIARNLKKLMKLTGPTVLTSLKQNKEVFQLLVARILEQTSTKSKRQSFAQSAISTTSGGVGSQAIDYEFYAPWILEMAQIAKKDKSMLSKGVRAQLVTRFDTLLALNL